jgi:predicted RNase H-like nuclease
VVHTFTPSDLGEHRIAIINWTDATSMTAVGVDGCRGGWVVAGASGVEVFDRLAAVIARHGGPMGVDMPIGLPETWERAAERQARSFIRPRGSTIFPTPPRRIVSFDSYESANAASKETFGVGLTRQTFNLFPKLREVDALVRTTDAVLVEVHPECSFRALTGRVLPPKRTAEGATARRAALEPFFGALPVRVAGARPDDVLDAYAVLWTMRRFEAGRHLAFGDGAVDRYGTVMQIVA